MPRLDLTQLKVAAGVGNLDSTLSAMLDQCAPDDPPYLSDLIIREQDGGLFVKMELENRYNRDRNKPLSDKFTWKLLVLRDEWGNPPVPGEYVTKRQLKPLDTAPGKPATSRELTEDKRAGDYDKKWIDEIRYQIDAKGCIVCEFQDAAYFLMSFGVHGKSGRPISMHRKPTSKDWEGPEMRRPELSNRPVEAPDGNKLHVWYWRYQEVDRDEYEKLPILQPSNEPKRGVKK